MSEVIELLSLEETVDLASKLTKSMKLRNEIEFGDTSIKTPEIEFFSDEEQFFDPSEWKIHIGSLGITNRFEAEDEKDFEKALEFVQGHESQHVHSTASKPYAWGIQRGTEIILEYIALKEDGITKPERKFKRERDYERYAEELANRGIYISWSNLRQIIAGIANSIEDGRIEGIRAGMYKGFATLRVYFRGMFWRQGASDKLTPYSDLNAGEKLRIISNQILFLATCQLYQPNFFMTYVGTPMIDEVKELMPMIAKGVSAPTCREMAFQVVEICKKLAPLMYEAFRVSKEDVEAQKAIKKLIEDMIRSAIESNIDNIGGLSEKQEQQGNGELPNIFGNSDLEITLPDDVYDKLMEEKGENQSGSGIKVKREHPKEEEEKKEEATDGEPGGESNGSSKEKSEEQQGSGSGKPSDSESNENSSSSGKGEGNDEEKAESNSGSENSSGSSNNMDSDNNESSAQDSSDNSESSASQQSKPSESSSSQTGKSELAADSTMSDDVLKQVEDAMKEAAERSDYEAEKTIENVNSAATHESRADRKKENPDKEAPLKPEDFKDICRNFKELKREYEVNLKMPAVLEARCRAMYRKNKRYFKSLSTPNVSHLDSGNVDPSLIYGLSFGDTEIFRKTGKDKKFDGCAYILIDNSGSMSGNKRIEACKAAAVIEEGFKEIMPLKIVAFDEWGEVVHEVVKNWDERLSKNCCWNFACQGREGCGNEDGYDIQIATRELLKRPEARKMLCILSDGAPGNRNLVKSAVQKARKKGIEVYSIYFEEGSIGSNANDFKYMYEKDFVCCELSEVDEHLSKLFKKFSRK